MSARQYDDEQLDGDGEPVYRSRVGREAQARGEPPPWRRRVEGARQGIFTRLKRLLDEDREYLAWRDRLEQEEFAD
jgi:hypothetical protein